MGVRGQVRGSERDRRVAVQLPNHGGWEALGGAGAIRRAPGQVGQREGRGAIAAVDSTVKREQSRILGYGQDLTVGGRPADWTKIKAEQTDLAKIHILRGSLIGKAGDEDKCKCHRGEQSLHGVSPVREVDPVRASAFPHTQPRVCQGRKVSSYNGNLVTTPGETARPRHPEAATEEDRAKLKKLQRCVP